ncbi:nucleotidyltransferase domain-containing protein [Cohnella caldifontis]|uniref:nucleotidyltransferase domain-containing protein n=1 Tax=Cohnella caldifontis TaxID=3027471 RepID=UPI0023EAB3A1|nr:nucleotidyltransferase domain-containing protein [Cohnella sp. YIM B05605]
MDNPHTGVTIRAHHQEAIDALVCQLRDDPSNLAIIIAGSVAKGVAREDSDIDCYLVVNDEEFEARKQRDQLFYFAREGCDYPGGYYDGKIIPYRFLEEAAVRGSEPTRASFDKAFVVFSRIFGLDDLIARIPIYPEQNRERNFQDFFAQVELYGGYFAERAIALGNAYLLTYAIGQVVLFSGRLLLAYNRVLFPCHKSLQGVLRTLPLIPDRYFELQEELLRSPDKESIRAFVACIRSFHDWGIAPHEAVSRFIQNNEWNWLDGEPPLSDR